MKHVCFDNKYDIKIPFISQLNVNTNSMTLTFLYYSRTYTVGENIIAAIKMRNNLCYPLKMIIFLILR